MGVQPTNRRGRRRTTERRNAGLAMLLVLMSVAMAAVLSLAFLNGQATATGLAANLEKRAQARAIAESGLAMALAYIDTDANWRTNRTSGTWFSAHAYAGGVLTVSGEDGQDTNGDGVVEGDGDLVDDASDVLTLSSLATFAGVSHRVHAVVTPKPPNKRVLLVVEDASNLTQEIRDLESLFESWDFEVTPISASESQSTFDSSVANHDVVFLPSHGYLGDLGSKLYNVSIGVVLGEPYLHSTYGIASSNGVTFTGTTDIDITNTSHAITETLPAGANPVAGHTAAELVQIAGSVAPGATVLASRVASAAPVLAAIEIGAALSGGSPAAGRRVGLPWGGASWLCSDLGNAGLVILRSALDWAGEQVVAGQIAHWDLDEVAGTTAGDSVGAYDGTLHNGVGTGQSGALLGSMAMTFDGANDHVEVAHNNAFLLDEGTVAFWFRTASTSDQGLVSKDSSGTDTGGHLTVWIGNQRIYYRLQDEDEDSFIIESSSGSVQLNTWYHVAATFGSAGMKLYLNGILVDSDSYSGGTGTTSGGSGNFEPMAFGVSTMSSGDLTISGWSDPLSGAMDEVYVFNRALSASEVATLMTPPGGSGLAYDVRWTDQP